jgi:uncharacterized protein
MPHLASPTPLLPALASSVLAASLCLLPCPGLGFAVRDVPNPRQSHGGWVVDSAGILRRDTETSINGMIDVLERRDGSEVMVVTVPDTSGSPSPKNFATELFNTLKIGKKGVGNGVLMLISKGDRRVEIETGYGMEERLPDARAGAIIETVMLPRFKQGDFDGGTLAGTGEVIGTLSPEAGKNLAVADKRTDSSVEWLYLWIFCIALWALALFLLWVFARNGMHGGGFSSGDSSSSSGDSFSSSRDSFFSSSGGGSRGDSGSGSGGGSSGGGGAGGSW